MKKLSLISTEQSNAIRKQMQNLKGGYGKGEPGNCSCGCKYEGKPGGSSDFDNGVANNLAGIQDAGVTNGFLLPTVVVANKKECDTKDPDIIVAN
jgi:natural product precursor